ncbi:MAG TPA: hypothetical protein PLI09_15855 [Candidatus Hydrogenedentes bacterium]|nr:hypothetical protein [Candidatus Hydrogenedentota bacterium]
MANFQETDPEFKEFISGIRCYTHLFAILSDFLIYTLIPWLFEDAFFDTVSQSNSLFSWIAWAIFTASLFLLIINQLRFTFWSGDALDYLGYVLAQTGSFWVIWRFFLLAAIVIIRLSGQYMACTALPMIVLFCLLAYAIGVCRDYTVLIRHYKKLSGRLW